MLFIEFLRESLRRLLAPYQFAVVALAGVTSWPVFFS